MSSRLLGCLSKAQFISSSGRVLRVLPPITNPQFGVHPGFLLARGNHIRYALKNAFRIDYHFCFFIISKLKIQPLIICTPLALKDERYFSCIVINVFKLCFHIPDISIFILCCSSHSLPYQIAVCTDKVYDTVVVLGVLILKSTALDDFHCF